MDKKYYVYKFLNENNEVLYVGRTINLCPRLHQHFSDVGHLDFECYCNTRKIEYVELYNEFEMRVFEIFFINYYKGVFNKEFSGLSQTDLLNNQIINIDYVLNYTWNVFDCNKLVYFNCITGENYYQIRLKDKKESDEIRNQQIKEAYLCLNLGM